MNPVLLRSLAPAPTRSWQRWATLPLNERQIKLLNRLLDGFDGKLTSSNSHISSGPSCDPGWLTPLW